MNNLNLVKSKYPLNRKNVIILVIYCVVLFVAIAGWRFYLFQSISKNYLLLLIYAMTFSYYFGVYRNRRNELKDMKYVSEHARKCMSKMKKCLFYEFALTLVVMILVVIPTNIRDADLYNLSVLFFIFIVGYMLMNYQFIVGFGQKYYVSGDGKLRYDEIKQIEDLKRIQAFEGILVYVKIILANSKVCYDKFLIDEYMYLMNQVDDER